MRRRHPLRTKGTPDMALSIGALLWVVFVILVAVAFAQETKAQTLPKDLPTLQHRDYGSTISEDSRVMRELARDPVWVNGFAPGDTPCAKRVAAMPVSLAMVRARLIAPLGVERWEDEPPVEIRRLPRLWLTPPATPDARHTARQAVRAGAWRIDSYVEAPSE